MVVRKKEGFKSPEMKQNGEKELRNAWTKSLDIYISFFLLLRLPVLAFHFFHERDHL